MSALLYVNNYSYFYNINLYLHQQKFNCNKTMKFQNWHIGRFNVTYYKFIDFYHKGSITSHEFST